MAKERGRLKIFFGYAAGVGKTYAMLQAALGGQGKGNRCGDWFRFSSYNAGNGSAGQTLWSSWAATAEER